MSDEVPTATIDVERVEFGDRWRRLVGTQRRSNLGEDLAKGIVEALDRERPIASVELSPVAHTGVRSGLLSVPERRRGTPRAQLLVDVAPPKADPLDDFELLSARTAE
ncbi:MAG: hypothetical protein IPM79_14655 [Polyangiaceae bacterium]|nr:hypothetical protein [Polyangiaceae bacterium]